MLEVFPEIAHLKDLAGLAAQRGDIQGAIEAERLHREATERFYDAHTATQLGSLHALAATHVLGEGKTVADLPVIAREALTDRFSAWVQADPARVERYNKLDTGLVGEFWPIYRAAMYDPARRAESVAAITTAGARPAVPVGGAVSAPVAAPPRQPSPSDNEDDIYDRSWQAVLDGRRG